ncbi:lysozyme inhibitor LprI family protein [Ruegeria faecimaris]|uniref:lysozyme inhibitor LprI family protein n=1 Tax=Ruegeria faecimaris TaxID=686389 RepID=UPI00232F2794|nr:lysozyme inhibitor LprI family protein [Ruegeria faecimaris]
MRLVILAVLTPTLAVADPAMECTNASSQVEIGSCVASMEAGVEAALTDSFGFAMDAANALDEVTGRTSAAPAMEAAQSAWVGYRDAQCEAVGASFGGGSGTGIGITSCRIELGRLRIDELLRFVN